MSNSVFLLLATYYLLLAAAKDSSSSDIIPNTTRLILEKEELNALYEVIGSLLDDTAWAQNHPQPCTDTPWPGIECEVDQNTNPPTFHITKIHIGPDILNYAPCKPSASLSSSLPKLPFLKTLSLFNCFTNLSVSLPESVFGSVSSLEHLTLESNPSLIGKVPSTLASSMNLRVLSLKQNSLVGEIPKEIGGLRKLEQLDFSYNNLSGIIPQELGGLESLTILDLSFNSLEGRVPSNFENLQNLQKLDLSFNQLNKTIPRSLGKLQKLVLLDLSYNFLNGPLPSSLSGLVRLEYFLIDHNPLKTQFPMFLGPLNKLKTLSLSSCELTGSLPTYFSSMQNLTALSLDHNALTGHIPTSLGLLSNLGQLNLSQNQLSGEVLLPDKFISRLGNRFDVRGNKELCMIRRKSERSNVSVYLGIPDCLGNDHGERGRTDAGEQPTVGSKDWGNLRANGSFRMATPQVMVHRWLLHFALVFYCFTILL